MPTFKATRFYRGVSANSARYVVVRYAGVLRHGALRVQSLLPLMSYYVALVDRKGRPIDFSEIACEDALDAAECEEFLRAQDSTARTMIGYRPEPDEIIPPHVCRGCNCQFDRNGRLIA